MKPTIALLALFMVACGGGESSVGPTSPTSPTSPTARFLPPAQIDDGQLLTYGNAVADLRAGIAQYEAAIVFLPGLRDAATGTDLDSRALVSDTSSGACSIWCSPSERAQVRRRAPAARPADWIAAVLAARLPLTPGAPLRAITVADGRLGDRSSGAA